MKKEYLILLLMIGIVMSIAISCTKASEDELALANNICDTTNVTYSQDIVSILKNNCYECHGANSNGGSGGIVLEGYSNLSVYVNNGYFIGNVTHAPGYIGMPYGRAKLPDCEINKIVAWVNRGAINN